jgi:hypothetical protein
MPEIRLTLELTEQEAALVLRGVVALNDPAARKLQRRVSAMLDRIRKMNLKHPEYDDFNI